MRGICAATIHLDNGKEYIHYWQLSTVYWLPVYDTEITAMKNHTMQQQKKKHWSLGRRRVGAKLLYDVCIEH